MIGSKAVGLLRNVARGSSSRKLVVVQQKRHSSDGDDGWNYRTMPEPPKWAQRGATLCATICYWWLGWNLYHGWGHLIGLYDGHFLPDPRDYTDEELGIPPDDA